jgi:parallel beta-helix repeat protein
VARVRAVAPHDITFDNITLIGSGGNPFYLSSGVNHVRLINSELKGRSSAVGIYLEAESFANLIQNNWIHVQADNEQIAVDASSHNTIVDNKISQLSTGGIYLYRNCGERGVVRYSTPSFNQIINNFFYYDNYQGYNPGIWLGSRNGRPGVNLWNQIFDPNGYCNDDKDKSIPRDIESSVYTQRDYPHDNVIAQNQFTVWSPAARIRDQSHSTNYVFDNERVSDRLDRGAGCYTPDLSTRLLLDGRSETKITDTGGTLTCKQVTCRDSTPVTHSCDVPTGAGLDFGCSITQNDAGCTGVAQCPAGQHLVAIKAACNLELGTVSSTQLDDVAIGQISVVRNSDIPSDGHCAVLTADISTGATAVPVPTELTSVAFSCREHDSTGGDCQIVGKYYCQ